MVRTALAAALASACLVRVGAVPARYGSMLGDRHRLGSRPGGSLGPPPSFVTQRQDHFDGSNPNTWQQAYYVNDTFWKAGSIAPIWLCVGGEGPALDGSAVVSSDHCNVAAEWLKETGALMFALEHRYYGCHNVSACPVDDLRRPGALRYLSSRQALADIAAFVEHASKAYGLSSNKWVTWGGSYPGMLAGWARLKFPHLIHASVASSAPVRAELNMHGYNNVVAAAYAVEHERVNGSAACKQAIGAGHRQIGDLFGTDDGRHILAALFGKDPDYYASRDNQLAFAGYGVADFPAQANDPACTVPMCSIAKICAAMTNISIGDEVHRLAYVHQQQRYARQQDVLPEQPPEGAARPTPGFNWVDLWGWQTCTEFGFYQTCEVGSECFYTQGLSTLETEMSFCKDDFGIPSDLVADNIDFSNDYYGADHPEGSRVLYVNGEVDPWHANSINVGLSSELPALYVEGSSHHFWTHQSHPTDQASVVEARKAIREQVASFLEEPRDAGRGELRHEIEQASWELHV